MGRGRFCIAVCLTAHSCASYPLQPHFGEGRDKLKSKH